MKKRGERQKKSVKKSEGKAKCLRRSAFCTFLIKNDSYLPGILTFAYAIRKQEINADLICVVTPDITEECVQTISYIYDYVFCVDQFKVKNNNKEKRQDREYLFIRFSVLDIVEKQLAKYERVIICDADLLPLRNFLDLYHVPTPSGILNEKKENVVGYNERGKWIWYDVYKEIPPGTVIPKSITDKVKNDPENLGVNSCIYVLSKGLIKYKEIQEDLQKDEIKAMIAKFPWPEMQYMTYKLSGKWHNLDLKYASFNSFPDLHSIYGTHYSGMKPWEINNKSYLHYCNNEDYKLWICVYLNMMSEFRIFSRFPKLVKIEKFLLNLVRTDKKYVLNAKEYPELKHLLR